jgi:hypothetical protein
MAKLTLSIDDEVIAVAKKYAKEHDTSVSRMVENYLRRWTLKPKAENIGPITASLIGIAKGADPDAYKKHILEKYS